jgi:hypothetical protein
MNQRYDRRKEDEGIIARLDALEAGHVRLSQEMTANTLLTKKTISDNVRLEKLVRRIDKNTSAFVAITEAGIKAGKVTFKGVGLFRTVLLWISPVIVAAGSIYLTFREFFHK